MRTLKKIALRGRKRCAKGTKYYQGACRTHDIIKLAKKKNGGRPGRPIGSYALRRRCANGSRYSKRERACIELENSEQEHYRKARRLAKQKKGAAVVSDKDSSKLIEAAENKVRARLIVEAKERALEKRRQILLKQLAEKRAADALIQMSG